MIKLVFNKAMITHNILICDEVPLISVGLETVIKQKYPNCQIFKSDNFENTLSILGKLTFDVIFIDISRNGFNEYSILKKIKIIQPKLTIIVVSFLNEIDFKERCFKHGASAVLNKTCSEESLHQVLNIYLFGGSFFSNKIKLFLEIKPFTKKSKLISTTVDTLSSREYELALLLISGLSGKDIAKKLDIAPTTVSTYKRRILIKTSTTNILQLEKVIKGKNSIDSITI